MIEEEVEAEAEDKFRKIHPNIKLLKAMNRLKNNQLNKIKKMIGMLRWNRKKKKEVGEGKHNKNKKKKIKLMIHGPQNNRSQQKNRQEVREETKVPN